MANSSVAGFTAAVIVVGTLAASATAFNTVSGMSGPQTGAWSYFGRLDGGAAIPLAPESCGGTSGLTCVGNGQAAPNHISVSGAGGGPASFGAPQAADTLSLDPGSGAAIARWTAAAAGTYDITGSFTDDGTQDSPPEISIMDSQSAIPLLAPAILSGSVSFNFDNVRFAIGDFVDFVASAGSPIQSPSIGLDPTITGTVPGIMELNADPPADVPEPGSLALLGSAALCLGLARWKSARRKLQGA